MHKGHYLILAILSLLFGHNVSFSQKISYSEFDLPNGLHVILHKDNSVPVVTVSVMYHVGSKNEISNRSGFAHFFEHLLFEGTDNIKRGEFSKIVSSNGGQSNANTTQDRTFFYEIFPSNQLALGLWLESERMYHPIISEEGINTQKEVVKEEKRERIDNQPYGNFDNEIFEHLFSNHPYRRHPIGLMKDLDSAKKEEFEFFFKEYYIPGNAVLSISGDLDISLATQLIYAYFGPIPEGKIINYNSVNEAPIMRQLVDTAFDSNIQIPAVAIAYRIPGMNSKESRIIQLISLILSEGQSSRLYKKLVDEKGSAAQLLTFRKSLEDYGVYVLGAIPNNDSSLNGIISDIDSEIKKLQSELIGKDEYLKIQNQAENSYINENIYSVSIAENLASSYTFYAKNTNHINEKIIDLKKITRDEIREAANNFLNSNNRLLLYYLPAQRKLQ